MKLLYIRRVLNGCEVVYDNKVETYNRVPETVINWLCTENMSTFDGRRTAIKSRYGIKKMTPVMVNEDILLFPTHSVRVYENVWINYHEVINVKNDSISFHGGKRLIANSRVVNRQLKKCYEIAF